MHANLKILRKVREFLRGRTTARPHVLESLRFTQATQFYIEMSAASVTF